MWPTTNSVDRFSKPPTGLRHGSSRSYKSSSSASKSSAASPLGASSFSNRSTFSQYEDDDNSSCDDTYVSMASGKGRHGSRDKPKKGPPRILQETTRGVNYSKSPNTSGKLLELEGTRESSTSAAGILDKLKHDIDSLELLRSTDLDDGSFSTYPSRFETNSTDDGKRGSDFAGNKEKPTFGARRSNSFSLGSPTLKDRSVGGNFFRESDSGERRSLRRENSASNFWHNDDGKENGRSSRTYNTDSEKEDKALLKEMSSELLSVRKENDELQRTVRNLKEIVVQEHDKKEDEIHQLQNRLQKALGDANVSSSLSTQLDSVRKENEQLTETLRNLKEEVMRGKEEGEAKTNSLIKTKREADAARENEAKLECSLREIIGSIEEERLARSSEWSASANLQKSELMLLKEQLASSCEKVNELKENEFHIIQSFKGEISEKNITIKELEENLDFMERKLGDAKQQEDTRVSKIRNDMEASERENVERIRRLEEEMSILNRDLKTVRETNMDLLEQKDSLDKENQNNIQTIQHLRNNSDDVKKQLQESRIEVVGAKQQLDQLKFDARRLQSEKEEEAGRSKELEARLATLENSSQEQAVKVELLESKLAESEAKCRETRVRLENSTQKKTDAEHELNEMTQKAKKLKSTLEDNDARIHSLEEQLAGVGKEKLEMELKIEALTKSLSNSESELADATGSLKISLRKTQDAADEIKSQLQKALSKLDDLTQKNRDLSHKIDGLNAENSELKLDLSSKERDLSEMNAQKSSLLSDLSSKERDLLGLRQKVETLENKVAKLNNDVKERNEKLKDMSNVKKKQQTNIEELEKEASSSKRKIKDYEAKMNELRTDLDSAQKRSSSIEQEASSLRSHLKTVTGQLQASERKGESLKDELIKANRNIDSIHQELKTAKEESKSRNDQLRSALSSLDEMMKYIDNTREENDDIVKSLEVEISNAHSIRQELESGMKHRISALEQCKKENQEMIEKYREEKKLLLIEVDTLKDQLKKEQVDTLRLTDELGCAREKLEIIENERTNLFQEKKLKSNEIQEMRQTHENQVSELSKKHETTVSELKKSLIDSLCEVESLQHKVKRLETQNIEDENDSKGRLERLKASFESQSTELSTSQRKVKELEESLERSSLEVESLRLAGKKFQAQIDEIHANAGILDVNQSEVTKKLLNQKKRLDEILSEKEQSEHVLSEIKMEKESLTSKLKHALSDNEELSTEIMRLKSSLQSLDSTVSVLQRSNDTLTNELSASQKELGELKKELESSKMCANCNELRHSLEEKQKSHQEMQELLQDHRKNDLKLRGEMAQSKQMMAMFKSNEKHLEDHIASLEAQISSLVSDYESKLQQASAS